MSVIIRVDWEGVTYDLDIQEDIPLRLDISAVENTEIGEFFGVGSQTFDLPGTKNNNKFFKHAYNVGGEDIPAFSNTIDGRIISRGETLLKGQFQLLEVVKDESGYVVYKCQIADETVQFKDVIQNKLIKNADWSAYQHTLNTGSILDSWDDNLLSGSVFYPLADYGYNDPESQGNYPLFAFGNGSTGTFFNNPLTPIQPAQFLPAIKAKDVLQVICAQAGFSASGDFINSSDFSNLYILPKAKEEIGIVITGSEQAIGYVTNNFNQSIPIGSVNQELSLNQEYNDPLGKFFTSGSQEYGYYLADGNGEYEVRTQIGFFNPLSFAFGEVKVKLTLMRGSFPFSGTVIASEERNFKSTDGFNTFYLNAGGKFNSSTSEEVWAWVDYTVVSGSPTNDLYLFGFSSVLEVTSAPEVYNDATVDMALQWPADLKSIDIVKGLIQQFNLVVYPSPDQDKTIIFEQFDEWIKKGQVKDWTDKWDTAVRTSINHTVDEQPQELILGNEEDSDRFSVEAKESDPYYQYGTLRILADNNVSQGSRKIKNTFGPTVLGGPFISGSVKSDGTPTYNIDLGSSFAYPHLYKFENNQIKSYKFRPRIGYKSNNSFPSGSEYQLAIGTSGTDRIIVTGSYGTLSNVNGLPAVDGAQDLHFNNSYFKFAGPGLNLGNTKSNFDTYWKTYIDSLYWDGNRKVTLDIHFNTEEYKDLKLNDIIFIKDQQYRINKIKGFNLTNDDIVTVELIRLYPQYYQNNPNCDFSATVEPADCDFTFEAFPQAQQGVCTQYLVNLNQPTASIEVEWVCCSDTNQTLTKTLTRGYGVEDTDVEGIYITSVIEPIITEIKPSIPQPLYSLNQYASISLDDRNVDVSEYITYEFNPFAASQEYAFYPLYITTSSCDWIPCTDYMTTGQSYTRTVISGSIIPPYFEDISFYNLTASVSGATVCVTPTPPPFTPTPTPTPSPTPGGATPTPTPTPSGQTPTPTPSPTPQVYSYTGFVDYGTMLGACSSSTEVTIYTQGPIGTGSVAYEDASLTNVFDFYRFFVDGDTGIGYEFVDPNTTGTVIDVTNDACNVTVFTLGVDFNEYDACTGCVTTTKYAAPGATLTNGTQLYTDINLQYDWTEGIGLKFVDVGTGSIQTSGSQIYYYTGTGVSQSGTDTCYGITEFSGSDFTATTPPSPIYCDDYEQQFYVSGSIQVGAVIYEDSCLTNPLYTGNNWVFNTDANELYRMGGDPNFGTDWVITEITSSVCTPPTPTPSPTPAPIVTQMSVSASWSSYYDACNNPGFTGTLYHTQIWSSIEQDYVAYFYEDNTQTNIFDFYQYVVDTSTGDGYRLSDPNTTGRVISTGSDVCNPGIFSLGIDFNEYEACTGCVTTTKYAQEQTMRNGLDIYTDIELEYDWTEGIGTEFTISGSNQIWVYTGAARFGGSGAQLTTGSCYSIYEFQGNDYSGTGNPPPPTVYCSSSTEQSWYTKDRPVVGTFIYEDACLTDTIATSQLYVYNDTDNELYVMGYLDDGVPDRRRIAEITGSYCTPPTPTPSPSPSPTPTPTPTPTPSPTPAPMWHIIYTENCTSTVGKYFNWYGSINNFPGPTVYDSQNGCLQTYWQGAGYNSNYEILDCSTRYDYFDNCSDCQNNVNQRPCVTPAPTPTPTPGVVQWWILLGELCSQTSTQTLYNWYGDINNFPAALFYDSNTGYCNDVYLVSAGYNAAYDTIDCSTRYEYYNTCSDCQSGINQQPCTGPTPPPSPTPTPTPTPAGQTPTPTPAPSIKVYEARECYTTPTFYIWYNGTVPSNYYKSGSGCFEIVQEVNPALYDPNDPTPQTFHTSCGDCYSAP